IDFKAGTLDLGGTVYPLADKDFPTIDPRARAVLTGDERTVMDKLCQSFSESERLGRHIRFLYATGSIYRVENGNLLYHGAVPMTEDGELAQLTFEGRSYAGRALMDYCEVRARRGYFAPENSPERQSGGDFLWFLWCGRSSPLFGRDKMTTFERLFVADSSVYDEKKDPYYHYIDSEETANLLLREFDVTDITEGHIINGHVPVRASNGERPVKGGGKIIVIDGGFCRAYHERTGIAGYTLVFNSHGLSLRAHEPFESTAKAISENRDIVSTVDIFETAKTRILVGDTDEGKKLIAQISDLKMLLCAYELGLIKEQA
ncbi:MAG: fructose-bisphosphatase class III, partial [Pygmaiobacter sp.]